MEKEEFEPRVRNAKQRLARLENEAAEVRNRETQRAILQQVLRDRSTNFLDNVQRGYGQWLVVKD